MGWHCCPAACTIRSWWSFFLAGMMARSAGKVSLAIYPSLVLLHVRGSTLIKRGESNWMDRFNV